MPNLARNLNERESGRAAAIERKRFRREVAAGRASWSDCLPDRMAPHPEMASGAPVAPVRVPMVTRTAAPRGRVFGEGLLRSLPSYRAPSDFESLAWWEEQNARAVEGEGEREIDRLAEIAAYEARFDGWY